MEERINILVIAYFALIIITAVISTHLLAARTDKTTYKVINEKNKITIAKYLELVNELEVDNLDLGKQIEYLEQENRILRYNPICDVRGENIVR